MKRLSVLLFAALLVLGLGSCNKETGGAQPQPKSQPQSLTLTPTTVTLKVGDTKQFTATVEPKDQAFTVTFSSDNEQVATVDAKGLVTAVAEGTANITAKVGDLTAKGVITVTKDNSGGTVTEGNELPLLMFEATIDGDGVTNQEVLDHEAKVGRTAKPFKIWGQGPFVGGFVNPDLTIVAAMYGLSFDNTGEWVIPAFSKESYADCPKTLKMLAEYGFTKFDEGRDKENIPFKKSVCNNDPELTVELYEDLNVELGSSLIILFIKTMPKHDIKTLHDIIPNAKDFPSYEALKTKDIAKIKEFEATLGLREYNSEKSTEDAKNLMFMTKKASIDQTNLSLAYYICTPGDDDTPFIHTIVNCVKNANDFEDPKLKEWFTANGYGTDFNASAADGFAFGTDPTGKIIAQIVISKDGTMALLQIFEDTEARSAAQMRSLAMQQCTRMQSLTKTKHRKLQQMRHR